MKKEWILSEKEKQQKRAKIEENRAKKRTPSSNPASNNPSASSAVNSPQDSDGDEEGAPPSPSPQDSGEQSPEAGEGAVTGGGGAAPALLESRPQARVLPSARSENGGTLSRPSKVMMLIIAELYYVSNI